MARAEAEKAAADRRRADAIRAAQGSGMSAESASSRGAEADEESEPEADKEYRAKVQAIEDAWRREDERVVELEKRAAGVSGSDSETRPGGSRKRSWARTSEAKVRRPVPSGTCQNCAERGQVCVRVAKRGHSCEWCAAKKMKCFLPGEEPGPERKRARTGTVTAADGTRVPAGVTPVGTLLLEVLERIEDRNARMEELLESINDRLAVVASNELFGGGAELSIKKAMSALQARTRRSEEKAKKKRKARIVPWKGKKRATKEYDNDEEDEEDAGAGGSGAGGSGLGPEPELLL